MRAVARGLALDIYPLDQILEAAEVQLRDFNKWQTNPRFIEYLTTERDAWQSAGNTPERAKLKAGILVEEFMIQAHSELHDKKTPLNQRVELFKQLCKVAGMETSTPAGGAGGGFSLQINIAPGVAPVVVQAHHTIEHDDSFNQSMTS